MGHTPFGHAGEDALDAAVRAASGGASAITSSRSASRAPLNLTHEVCDGILTHTGAVEPETLEGKIVRSSTASPTSTTTSTTPSATGCWREEDLPREEIALLGSNRLGADRPARPRPRRVVRAAGDVRQSDEVGEAMLALRAFMFERVYLGPRASRSTGVRAKSSRRSSTTSPRTPGAAARPGRRVAALVDYVAGMTDRFALAYAAALGS